MIKIAVTGGIGSGKSYISHLLENMHIPVYNADNEAKRLTASDAGSSWGTDRFVRCRMFIRMVC